MCDIEKTYLFTKSLLSKVVHPSFDRTGPRQLAPAEPTISLHLHFHTSSTLSFRNGQAYSLPYVELIHDPSTDYELQRTIHLPSKTPQTAVLKPTDVLPPIHTRLNSKALRPSNMAFTGPTSTTSPASPQKTHKSRDQLIHEYVQAARERIESGPNTRGGPSSPSKPAPRSSTDRQRRPTHPAMNRAPPSQWPILRSSSEEQRQGSRRQEELAPYRNRAPPQQYQRPPHAGPASQSQAGSVDYRERPRNVVSQYPPSSRQMAPPPLRLHPTSQQRPRQQPSPQRRTSLESRYSTRNDRHAPQPYRPASNIHSEREQSMITSVSSPAPSLPPPMPKQPANRTPGLVQTTQHPNIHSIAEEDEKRISMQPSVSSAAMSDVLSEYYQTDAGQREEGTMLENANPEISAELGERPDLVREASIGHLSKPVVTVIRSLSKKQKDDPEKDEDHNKPNERKDTDGANDDNPEKPQGVLAIIRSLSRSKKGDSTQEGSPRSDFTGHGSEEAEEKSRSMMTLIRSLSKSKKGEAKDTAKKDDNRLSEVIEVSRESKGAELAATGLGIGGAAALGDYLAQPSPTRQSFVDPAGPRPFHVSPNASVMSIPTLKTKTSAESFATAPSPLSPRTLQKSPLKPVESRFRTSVSDLHRGTAAPPPPEPEHRDYFASAPSSSTVNLSGQQSSSRLLAAPDPGSDNRLSRSSVTSLPGLISRALRLASNLERGKTSSKFGVDWMTAGNGSNDALREKRKSANSMRSMLDAFPVTPGGSPRPDRGQLPLSQWPLGSSGLRRSQAMSSLPSTPGGERKPRRRKCCGMPFWLFILVIILVIIVVAAAIIIPVILMMPSQQRSNSTTKALASCRNSTTCAHGGSVTLSVSNTCSCLCINGWTGPTCTMQDTSGCVDSDLAGPGTSSTIGSSIPPLINLSQASFGISLNATSLYSTFDSADLSCASQNALVTFNGLSSRSLRPRRMAVLPKRQAAVMTTAGIILAASSTAAATPIQTASPSSTASAPVSRSTSDPDLQRTLAFARTAVLYVLQSTADLSTAVNAQDALQMYLSNRNFVDAENIDLGSGWTANLVAFTVTSS